MTSENEYCEYTMCKVHSLCEHSHFDEHTVCFNKEAFDNGMKNAEAFKANMERALVLQRTFVDRLRILYDIEGVDDEDTIDCGSNVEEEDTGQAASVKGNRP